MGTYYHIFDEFVRIVASEIRTRVYADDNERRRQAYASALLQHQAMTLRILLAGMTAQAEGMFESGDETEAVYMLLDMDQILNEVAHRFAHSTLRFMQLDDASIAEVNLEQLILFQSTLRANTVLRELMGNNRFRLLPLYRSIRDMTSSETVVDFLHHMESRATGEQATIFDDHSLVSQQTTEASYNQKMQEESNVYQWNRHARNLTTSQRMKRTKKNIANARSIRLLLNAAVIRARKRPEDEDEVARQEGAEIEELARNMSVEDAEEITDRQHLRFLSPIPFEDRLPSTIFSPTRPRHPVVTPLPGYGRPVREGIDERRRRLDFDTTVPQNPVDQEEDAEALLITHPVEEPVPPEVDPIPARDTPTPVTRQEGEQQQHEGDDDQGQIVHHDPHEEDHEMVRLREIFQYLTGIARARALGNLPPLGAYNNLQGLGQFGDGNLIRHPEDLGRDPTGAPHQIEDGAEQHPLRGDIPQGGEDPAAADAADDYHMALAEAFTIIDMVMDAHHRGDNVIPGMTNGLALIRLLQQGGYMQSVGVNEILLMLNMNGTATATFFDRMHYMNVDDLFDLMYHQYINSDPDVVDAGINWVADEHGRTLTQFAEMYQQNLRNLARQGQPMMAHHVPDPQAAAVAGQVHQGEEEQVDPQATSITPHQVGGIPDPRSSQWGGQWEPNVIYVTTVNPKYVPGGDEPPYIRKPKHVPGLGSKDNVVDKDRAQADQLFAGMVAQPHYAPIHAGPVNTYWGARNYQNMSVGFEKYVGYISNALHVTADSAIENIFMWNLLMLYRWGRFLYAHLDMNMPAMGMQGDPRLARYQLPVYYPKDGIRKVQQEFMELSELLKEVKLYQASATSRADREGSGAGPSKGTSGAMTNSMRKALEDFDNERSAQVAADGLNPNAVVVNVPGGGGANPTPTPAPAPAPVPPPLPPIPPVGDEDKSQHLAASIQATHENEPSGRQEPRHVEPPSGKRGLQGLSVLTTQPPTNKMKIGFSSSLTHSGSSPGKRMRFSDVFDWRRR